ncbi:MAG: hypothetical protein ACK5MW_01280 [Enterococcus sp.]
MKKEIKAILSLWVMLSCLTIVGRGGIDLIIFQRALVEVEMFSLVFNFGLALGINQGIRAKLGRWKFNGAIFLSIVIPGAVFNLLSLETLRIPRNIYLWIMIPAAIILLGYIIKAYKDRKNKEFTEERS